MECMGHENGQETPGSEWKGTRRGRRRGGGAKRKASSWMRGKFHQDSRCFSYSSLKLKNVIGQTDFATQSSEVCKFSLSYGNKLRKVVSMGKQNTCHRHTTIHVSSLFWIYVLNPVFPNQMPMEVHRRPVEAWKMAHVLRNCWASVGFFTPTNLGGRGKGRGMFLGLAFL